MEYFAAAASGQGGRAAAGPRGSLVIIGNFDGVHLGHQALLADAALDAERRGLEPVALTFAPHPASVLGRTPPATLTALPQVARAAVAPFAGQRQAVSDALRARAGAGLPDTGRVEACVSWVGSGQWLVEGLGPGEVADWLAGLAAVSDQTDAWAGTRLFGAAAPEMLTRLVPIDLIPEAFPPGTAARTLLRHVPLLLIAREEGAFELLVPRSYARTAVSDLVRAMRLVAGRAML